MDYQQLSRRVAEHVALFFIEHPEPKISFHNQSHTLERIREIQEMAAHYQLSERDRFVISAAAWFLDTGYFGGVPNENRSMDNAISYLSSIGVNETDLAEIKSLMQVALGTREPVTLNEKLLADAGTFYFGTPAFRELHKRARKESEKIKKIDFTGEQWNAITLDMLQHHTYHTDYALLRYEKTKQDNIEDLKKRMEAKALKKQAALAEAEQGGDGLEEKEKHVLAGEEDTVDIQRIKKKGGPIRGIETMFRVSSTNQQRLSVMADNKAHIMISVNSIIISIAIALVIGKFGEQPALQVPTVMLLFVNVFTIIFSVLATRPKIAPGKFTMEQVENKSVNLLFFGSYYRMGYEDYELGMTKMMNDGEFLYRTLIKNIYWQGKVIGRKFFLLRIAYDIFMYGIAISVLVFTIMAVIHK